MGIRGAREERKGEERVFAEVDWRLSRQDGHSCFLKCGMRKGRYVKSDPALSGKRVVRYERKGVNEQRGARVRGRKTGKESATKRARNGVIRLFYTGGKCNTGMCVLGE